MTEKKGNSDEDKELLREIRLYVNNSLEQEISLTRADLLKNIAGLKFFVAIPAIHQENDYEFKRNTKRLPLNKALKKAIKLWREKNGGFRGYLGPGNFTFITMLKSGRQIIVPERILRSKIHKILHEMRVEHLDYHFKN